MNEIKHTPGPWITDTSHSHEWEGITIWNEPSDPDGIWTTVIAHVVPDQHEEHEANAKLIAAAPDLLAACKKMLNLLESEPATYIYRAHKEMVKSAIAKATE
jgi:hypothetical protein